MSFNIRIYFIYRTYSVSMWALLRKLKRFVGNQTNCITPRVLGYSFLKAEMFKYRCLAEHWATRYTISPHACKLYKCFWISFWSHGSRVPYVSSTKSKCNILPSRCALAFAPNAILISDESLFLRRALNTYETKIHTHSYIHNKSLSWDITHM